MTSVPGITTSLQPGQIDDALMACTVLSDDLGELSVPGSLEMMLVST